MKRIRPFKTLLLLLVTGMLLGGCQDKVVYQRSTAELSRKAQALMQAGDYAGAAARLEAARDLQPEEPSIQYNLAVAYQMQGKYDEAIALFKAVQDKPGLKRPEILKALGISHEAKADQLMSDAATLEEDAKADKAKIQEMKDMASGFYRAAIDYYRQALQAGLETPAPVENQIKALESRLNQPEQAALR